MLKVWAWLVMPSKKKILFFYCLCLSLFTSSSLFLFNPKYSLMLHRISRLNAPATVDYQWLWKAYKWTGNQKEGRSRLTKYLPMAKSVLQGWSSNLFLGVKCPRKCTYQRFVQTGPLYRDLGVVISSITSPRFTKANEFGYNFLNG